MVGAQRKIAVRAPAAPVEHDDCRTTLDDLVEADRRAGGVVEGERLEDIAGLDAVGGDPLGEEVVDALLEDIEDIGRQMLGCRGLELLGLLADGQGHGSSQGSFG